MNKLIRYFCFIVLFLNGIFAHATHNRAGDISVEQIGPLTVRATITTYTKARSQAADRDSLTLDWGDGTKLTIGRANGQGKKGEIIADDTRKNLYIAIHTYPGRATYKLSMTDPNRNGGVLNVNPPGSDNIPFHLATTYSFLNPQFQGNNSTPVLLQPPIDFANVGQVFLHNPNAYDIDGDSLSYQLIVPYQDINTPVPNYSFPDQIKAGAKNQFSINAVTGDIVWNAPQVAGEYNVAFIIVEHRRGVAIDTVIRDMQIYVREYNNKPPVIKTVEEMCVIAGQLVDFRVVATDIDAKQKIKLTALGGPFQVKYNPATFKMDTTNFQFSPAVGRFIWQTSCEHASDQFYSIVFKAIDNFGTTNGDTTGLATLKTVRIKVVAPPPLDVRVVPGKGFTEITWQKPYACETAKDMYFQNFTVWRRVGSNQFPLDTCKNGLLGRGYTKVAFNVKEMVGGRYYFKDAELERGRTYCYRVIAEFAKLSAGSNPYNRVESLPSVESCVQISRDLPLMTHVSVEKTAAAGEIRIRWTKPKSKDLDTLTNAPPYRLKLFRTDGISKTNFVEVVGADFTANKFYLLKDTIFIDKTANTAKMPYTYRVGFYVNGEKEPIGYAEAASSIFLTIASKDKTNVLSWDESTAWENFRYVILRKNAATGIFDSIGMSTTKTFSDTKLINKRTYCYVVKSVGGYGITGVPNPLLNFSQETCGTPLDTMPPCPPVLEVKNLCNTANAATPEDQIKNNLIWKNPAFLCPTTSKDVAAYKIWYRAPSAKDFVLIFSSNRAADTTTVHRPDGGIAGCYAVSAIDSLGNESKKSNIICLDNCPTYNLPNAFTPNGDGMNDVFKPYPYRFIERVAFQVFNRWGQLVFETADANINWNGTNQGGQELAEGTYYYICKVYEKRVGGTTEQEQPLSGWIELVRK
jgi:gliding motility-associated-like protein